MKNYYIFFVLLLFCTSGLPLIAQIRDKKYIPNAERFGAGIAIGGNVAQLDGDNFTGYDKYGLIGGIKGIVRFTPRLDFIIEFLYSKKGSKNLAKDFSSKNDRIIDLTYMDVPILFRWLLREENACHIESGIIYSRLINNKVTEKTRGLVESLSYQIELEDLDKDDFVWTIGTGYTWKKGLSIHGRFGLSLTTFYKNRDIEAIPMSSSLPLSIESLRNYYLSLHISYAIL